MSEGVSDNLECMLWVGMRGVVWEGLRLIKHYNYRMCVCACVCVCVCVCMCVCVCVCA